MGVALAAPMGEKFAARLRADIGGFGAGSDVAYQVVPMLEWKASPTASLLFAYRVIGVDYRSGEGRTAFVYDVVMSGPAIAFTTHF